MDYPNDIHQLTPIYEDFATLVAREYAVRVLAEPEKVVDILREMVYKVLLISHYQTDD